MRPYRCGGGVGMCPWNRCLVVMGVGGVEQVPGSRGGGCGLRGAVTECFVWLGYVACGGGGSRCRSAVATTAAPALPCLHFRSRSTLSFAPPSPLTLASPVCLGPSLSQLMHGQFVGARRVRCGWAQHKTDAVPAPDPLTLDRADPSNTNVYVGNLAPSLSGEAAPEGKEGEECEGY
jgi:hypothetical protein